ncbi:unnamed protein product [Mycena citricolor]|uniref:DUF6534 domain-containing protein n=1 Tax=Mycena citricolor TaxID=2018698 RepID=A0AAD2HW53_9AGAR|nr:unnamed protein product [Mycena citricolor]CAK5281267.1 unnamed protein product [Mycena citricolor]
MVYISVTTLNLTIGCLLIASWANFILVTLECIETAKYFMRYPRDQWFNKISVLSAFACDILTVFCSAVTSYLYMVTHWGSEDYIGTQPWSIPVYILGTACTAAIVQIWLTRMVYNLTRQWYWLPIIALFILTGIVGGAATSAQLFINSSYTGRPALVRYVTIWLSGCVAADAIITAILVVKFRTMNAQTTFSDTRNLIRRLTIASLRNGSITTIMTIITVIVFSAQPEANSATMIEITIGRIYTLSMLSNLNNRSSLFGGSTEGKTSDQTHHHHANHNNTNTQGNVPTVLRIRQDIETHYQRDAIPMETRVGMNKSEGDLESAVEYQDGKDDDKYVNPF